GLGHRAALDVPYRRGWPGPFGPIDPTGTGRDRWGLRACQPEPFTTRPELLTLGGIQVQKPFHERRQVLVGRKVNRFGHRQTLWQHVPDDLAHQRAELFDVAHPRPRSASSAAPAACRTSASEPDRYSRPVAPIIR